MRTRAQIGSSIQIALFALPLLVIIGWAIGKPFSLDFNPFASAALILSVVQACFVTAPASSHWLNGVQLIAVYIIIAIVRPRVSAAAAAGWPRCQSWQSCRCKRVWSGMVALAEWRFHAGCRCARLATLWMACGWCCCIYA
jgi:hypothetical protein